MDSRRAGESALESISPPTSRVASGVRIATPTVTGPAMEPRPTSSIPATMRAPEAKSCCSYSRSAAGGVAFLGFAFTGGLAFAGFVALFWALTIIAKLAYSLGVEVGAGTEENTEL